MHNVYGTAPHRVVVVHGGPGAPGHLAPVARRLSADYGVLEPLQSRRSVQGQVDELAHTIRRHGDPPVILLGSSWGAMLAYLTAAAAPALIAKLIMIGSAPFDAADAGQVTSRRLDRLSAADRAEATELLDELRRDVPMDGARMARLDHLFLRADHRVPLDVPSEVIEYQHDVNRSVWNEVEQLQADGRLVPRGRSIRCPVVVMHGDYDPHPLDGVVGPLSTALTDLRVIVLEDCGHLPWMEQHAAERFWTLLRRELGADA